MVPSFDGSLPPWHNPGTLGLAPLYLQAWTPGLLYEPVYSPLLDGLSKRETRLAGELLSFLRSTFSASAYSCRKGVNSPSGSVTVLYLPDGTHGKGLLQPLMSLRDPARFQ